jgi:cyclophilin family peptidyl-prolyl cis-trans isomerase
MHKWLLILLLLPAVALAAQPQQAQQAQQAKKSTDACVSLQTSKGNITLKLFPQKAPLTVANFLNYVDSGFYNGTIFHRVISDFMIQGGGFDSHGDKKHTGAPIKNESSNGLKNDRGTIAMARTSNPDSADAQFFINLVDNSYLDYRPGHPGYAVFGKVVNGMKTVDTIGEMPTHVGSLAGYGAPNVPVSPIIISKADRVICPAVKVQ